VVLSGSLPPSTPVDWYAELVLSLRDTGARVAVDTSEAPLLALLAAGPDAAPDLLKPNAEELAQLAGVSEEEVLADPAATLAAVRTLHDRGVAEVLLTLGGDGALLSTADGGLWSARPPRIVVRSTVGAGDCSLAGYLLADLAGAPPADRLRNAVAYGAASASLPGSAVPTPAQVDGAAVRVTAGLPGTTSSSTAPLPAAGREIH
jgi:1-phosphofructokinase